MSAHRKTDPNEPGLLRAIDLAKELDSTGHMFGSRMGIGYIYRKNLPGLIKRLEDELRIIHSDWYGAANVTETIHWYEHDCEWISKYCDEHHLRSATVSRTVLETFAQNENALVLGKDES